jgi:hypothetical protein
MSACTSGSYSNEPVDGTGGSSTGTGGSGIGARAGGSGTDSVVVIVVESTSLIDGALLGNIFCFSFVKT